jgi:hypothetical protein
MDKLAEQEAINTAAEPMPPQAYTDEQLVVEVTVRLHDGYRGGQAITTSELVNLAASHRQNVIDDVGRRARRSIEAALDVRSRVREVTG